MLIYLTVGSLALACYGYFQEDHVLWMVGAGSLPLAFALAGAAAKKPVIAANLGLFWTAVMCSIVAAHLREATLPADNVRAALLSLGALMSLGFGYRIGYGHPLSRASEKPLDRHKLHLVYWISFVLALVLNVVAYLRPELTQIILAFIYIRLLALYLFSAQSFSDRKDLSRMVPVIIAELAISALNGIASYQLPILVVLAAALNLQKKVRVGQLLTAALLFSLLFWASLVWTAIKPEYRNFLTTANPSVQERLLWIWNSTTDINYVAAFGKFADRVGYIDLYAAALPRLDGVETHFYYDALLNMIQPRILFPDKAALDDTRITTELTGIPFDANTSVSIGYVAQAHADFGWPGMLLAVCIIGAILGRIANIFQCKPCSPIGRDGFMTAALAFKFAYENNIDKAISSLAIAVIGLLGVYKFLYLPFEKWALAPSKRTLATTLRISPTRAETSL